jgi:TPR repeat protein
MTQLKWRGFVVIVITSSTFIATLSLDMQPYLSLRASTQNNIGYLYWRGLGVSRDYDEAEVWFSRGVKNGSPEAANNLANLYEERGYLSHRREDIKALYEIAAHDGIAVAQNNLGVLLMASDPQKAAFWFERAYKSRDPAISLTAYENLRSATSLISQQSNE